MKLAQKISREQERAYDRALRTRLASKGDREEAGEVREQPRKMVQ